MDNQQFDSWISPYGNVIGWHQITMPIDTLTASVASTPPFDQVKDIISKKPLRRPNRSRPL